MKQLRNYFKTIHIIKQVNNMSSFFMIIIIGISLSMDAFSLAMIYGTQGIDVKNRLLLSFIVGIYHFIMPLIGLFFGSVIFNYIKINPDILVAIIFFIIGIEMIFSSKKEEKVVVVFSLIGFLIFGFSVSVDSLTTGVGLTMISDNYIQVSLTFAIVSSLFTYSGLVLGNKLNDIFGKLATLLGGIMLLFLGVFYLL